MTNKKTLAYPALPAGYDLYGTLDMAKDRGEFLRINIAGMIILAAMFFVGRMRVTMKAAFTAEEFSFLGFLAAVVVGSVVYILAHEWVHGVFIRIFTGEKAEFGFIAKAGMAYAKSSWFFTKLPYIIIALAPVVIWGVLFEYFIAELPDAYFWHIYILQIFNVSGAVGDLYVTWKVLRMPKGLLILDQGTAMKFFAPVNYGEE